MCTRHANWNERSDNSAASLWKVAVRPRILLFRYLCVQVLGIQGCMSSVPAKINTQLTRHVTEAIGPALVCGVLVVVEAESQQSPLGGSGVWRTLRPNATCQAEEYQQEAEICGCAVPQVQVLQPSPGHHGLLTAWDSPEFWEWEFWEWMNSEYTQKDSRQEISN